MALTQYYRFDVTPELEKMKLWLQTPKGKGTVGTMRFITHWLDGIPIPPREAAIPPSVPTEALKEYLEALWNPCRSLLAQNQISPLAQNQI